MTSAFLTDEDIRRLTGFAHKAKQVTQLRRMGVPFFVNASGQPVVACSAVQGGAKAAEAKVPQPWVPRVLRRA